MILKRVLYILIFLVSIAAKASFILLPMDENTTESLKSVWYYFLVFRKKLQNQLVTQLSWWFFLVTRCSRHTQGMSNRGVSFEVLSDGEEARIF
jgi:hypothetical protein